MAVPAGRIIHKELILNGFISNGMLFNW